MRTSRLLPIAALLVTAAFTVASAGSAQASETSARCGLSEAETTCFFEYTGEAETWTVPAGVTSITVELYGAQGATAGWPGGSGGWTHADIPVQAGTTYQVTVGGQGGDNLGNSGPGGFNGGGTNSASGSGGGGGGATDLRVAPFGDQNRILVAGGGGGGRGSKFSGGGAGGGPHGEDGYSGGKPSPGTGGAATTAQGDNSDSRHEGAGGGGWNGGTSGWIGFCGGGGGSGYASPDARNTRMETGGHAGDGLLIITYKTPMPNGND